MRLINQAIQSIWTQLVESSPYQTPELKNSQQFAYSRSSPNHHHQHQVTSSLSLSRSRINPHTTYKTPRRKNYIKSQKNLNFFPTNTHMMMIPSTLAPTQIPQSSTELTPSPPHLLRSNNLHTLTTTTLPNPPNLPTLESLPFPSFPFLFLFLSFTHRVMGGHHLQEQNKLPPRPTIQDAAASSPWDRIERYPWKLKKLRSKSLQWQWPPYLQANCRFALKSPAAWTFLEVRRERESYVHSKWNLVTGLCFFDRAGLLIAVDLHRRRF